MDKIKIKFNRLRMMASFGVALYGPSSLRKDWPKPGDHIVDGGPDPIGMSEVFWIESTLLVGQVLNLMCTAGCAAALVEWLRGNSKRVLGIVVIVLVLQWIAIAFIGSHKFFMRHMKSNMARELYGDWYKKR